MSEYIEREAAKRVIENCITEQTVSKYATSAECKAVRGGATIAMFTLDEIPAADVVEVRHGEWRYDGDYKACSLCGTFVEWNTLGTSHWKYCPYCGAKMDGKGEGE